MIAETSVQTRKKPRKNSEFLRVMKQLSRNKTAMIGLFILIVEIILAILAPYIAPYDYSQMDFMNMFATPSKAHLFGCDDLGRDIFSRVIYGTRYSLVIALFCTIAALFSGGLLGIIAGYFIFITKSKTGYVSLVGICR